MNNALVGPFLYPTSDDNKMELDDDNPIAKQRYKDQYGRFKATNNTTVLEVVNFDVDRLRQIESFVEAQYIQEEESVGG